jgi:hypothetical protein
MTAPYTPGTVSTIRKAIADGAPQSMILAQLGWNAGRLQRVCRAHGIDLRMATTEPSDPVPVQTGEPQPSQPSAPPPTATARRAQTTTRGAGKRYGARFFYHLNVSIDAHDFIALAVNRRGVAYARAAGEIVEEMIAAGALANINLLKRAEIRRDVQANVSLSLEAARAISAASRKLLAGESLIIASLIERQCRSSGARQ